MPIGGFATPQGTAAFAHAASQTPGFFRDAQGLTLSCIGVGTYLGDPTPEADRAYTAAIRRAMELGVNVLDSAINYRMQRSERSIAAAIGAESKALALDGAEVNRESIFVATKAGFLTPDGAMPADPRRYFQEEYFARGVMRHEDIAAGMHCMAPGYLADQLERSRRNLNLETIDLFYLHNPETQLSEIDYGEFGTRLRAAFEFLEEQVAANKIRWYGAATWNGFRHPPGAADHLPLEAMVALARQTAGDGHHFRFVQLPHNMAMPEASIAATQTLNGEACTLLEAAAGYGISVMTSASLMQARLPDLRQALAYAVSTPGVTTALVGMGKVEHVEANLI